MPVGGEILAFNDALTSKPEILNQDPYEAGWVIKIKINDPKEVDQLLSAADYKTHTGG
jgi:glycine cleavage system H protein